MAPRISFILSAWLCIIKWDVKNDFAYVLQFFFLNSDGLGVVTRYFKSKEIGRLSNNTQFTFAWVMGLKKMSCFCHIYFQGFYERKWTGISSIKIIFPSLPFGMHSFRNNAVKLGNH